MSAKWRRSKKHSERLSIFKLFSKAKNPKILKTFRVRSAWARRQSDYLNREIVRTYKGRNCKEAKPLIDVLEENDDITIVAEIAGFKRENIRIQVKNQRLTLAAEASERKYRKSLNLPKRVIPNSIRTGYKNGVLEIRLRKGTEEKAVDKVAG